MKKTIIPLIVSCYVVMFSYILVLIDDSLEFASYLGLIFVLVCFLLAILNLIVLVVNRRNKDLSVFRNVLLFKVIMIPFHIFVFAIGMIVLFGSVLSLFTVFFLASAPLILIGCFFFFFNYVMMISIGIHSVVQLINNRKRIDPVSFVLAIILQFIFFGDILSSMYLHSFFKGKEELE